MVCLSAIAERPQWRYDARLLLLPRSPLTTTTEPCATPRLMASATAPALYDGTLRHSTTMGASPPLSPVVRHRHIDIDITAAVIYTNAVTNAATTLLCRI